MRACVRAGERAGGCVCVYGLRTASTNKILRFMNTFMLIIPQPGLTTVGFSHSELKKALATSKKLVSGCSLVTSSRGMPHMAPVSRARSRKSRDTSLHPPADVRVLLTWV